MPEKNPDLQQHLLELFRSMLPFLYTFVISCWGGLAAYIYRIKKTAKRFNWTEAASECIISSFAGLITYFLCQWSNIDGALSAALIAISGHMGTKALGNLHGLYNRIFGLTKVARETES